MAYSQFLYTKGKNATKKRTTKVVTQKALTALFPSKTKEKRPTGARFLFAAKHKAEIDALFQARKDEIAARKVAIAARKAETTHEATDEATDETTHELEAKPMELWQSVMKEFVKAHAEEYEEFKATCRATDDDESSGENDDASPATPNGG